MSFDARLAVIGKHKAYNYEELTITGAGGGVGFTANILNTQTPPKRVYVTCETAQLRFRYDGTAPTSSVGHPLNPFDQIYVEGLSNMKNFKAIKTGSTSALLRCTFER